MPLVINLISLGRSDLAKHAIWRNLTEMKQRWLTTEKLQKLQVALPNPTPKVGRLLLLIWELRDAEKHISSVAREGKIPTRTLQRHVQRLRQLGVAEFVKKLSLRTRLDSNEKEQMISLIQKKLSISRSRQIISQIQSWSVDHFEKAISSRTASRLLMEAKVRITKTESSKSS